MDRDLMNAKDGMLWDELATGIKWIRRNADVLDDVHWVGGNQWNKEANEGAVYGWAAWNKNKATLAPVYYTHLCPYTPPRWWRGCAARFRNCPRNARKGSWRNTCLLYTSRH